ncbi:MAG: hypothetical protein IKH47_06935 [Bacteroidaceae bacterium]|nr:hypothetical protein [Bacteroidaceae bacterium]
MSGNHSFLIAASLSQLFHASPRRWRDHWRAARDACGIAASLSQLFHASPRRWRDHWRAARDACGIPNS